MSVGSLLARTILAAFGVIAMLGGCGAQLGQTMPTALGGLPTGAPPAPSTDYQYPAVHDMPPPRADPLMSESQEDKVEKELQAARDRQEGKLAPQKKAAKTTKKKPPADKAGENTGAKNNP